MSLPSRALHLVRRLPIFLFCLVLLPSFSLRAFFHIMGHFSCTLLTWQNKTLRSRYMPPTDAALPGPPVSISLSYSCLGGYAALGFVGPTSSASIGCFCFHVFPPIHIRAPQNVEKKSKKANWLIIPFRSWRSHFCSHVYFLSFSPFQTHLPFFSYPF